MKANTSHDIINSLTQIVIKYLGPGIPETYQGTEAWDLSFVDPDNKKEVDSREIEESLENIVLEHHADASDLIQKLWRNLRDGKIKQLVSYICLQERKTKEELFQQGTYIPLVVEGKYKKHITAFYRRFKDEHLLIILPLQTAELPDIIDWKKTSVKLPEFAPVKWDNKLTRKIVKTEGEIMIKDAFDIVPFGIYSGIPFEPARRAGILMHISSLPGKYGVGDFGKHAYDFVDFLNRTEQRFWQLLPLNISDELTGYSPYSSLSAFACNTLFIDPDDLFVKGLIDKSDLKSYSTKAADTVDYKWAEQTKNKLVNKAWQAFKKETTPALKSEYNEFVSKESYWLNDFGLFSVLKQTFNNKAWNEWPEEYRNRNKEQLQQFEKENSIEIEKIRFIQFLLSEQWAKLKKYANQKGIKIFGDIPIYVSFDSADVWANQQLFRLNPDKSMKAVAGVPPDYFNENGQLWNMPVYDWKKMEEDGFGWWSKRLKKNLEWFDIVRLDHFRGFSAFWEVPADHETAKNGKWIKGPGIKLLDTIQKKFPDMPFIAEDLGKIDEDVYKLRDKYDLPGMKVLQFGFDKNMPFLQHVPNNHTYNSIVYTGTHDNNTIRGWYRTEANKATRKRYKAFTGQKPVDENCHIDFIRLAYASVAKLVIIPMQDWLGLDEKHRMNFPATSEGNWLWRLKENQITDELERQIQKMVKTFGRY